MRYAFLMLALLFFVIWVVAFVAFHVASFFVHILLAIAVILFLVHLFRPR